MYRRDDPIQRGQEVICEPASAAAAAGAEPGRLPRVTASR